MEFTNSIKKGKKNDFSLLIYVPEGQVLISMLGQDSMTPLQVTQ